MGTVLFSYPHELLEKVKTAPTGVPSKNLMLWQEQFRAITSESFLYGITREEYLVHGSRPYDALPLVQKYKDEMTKVIPDPVDIRRTRTWGVEGDEYDEGRAMLPEAFCTHRRKHVPRGSPIVRLYQHIGTPFTVNADDLAFSGSAVVALTDVLEEAGYRVELNTVTALGKESPYQYHFSMVVRIKDADMPLDISTVAQTCADPCFFRAAILLDPLYEDFEWTMGGGYVVCGWKAELEVTKDLADEFGFGGIELKNRTSFDGCRRVVTDALRVITEGDYQD